MEKIKELIRFYFSITNLACDSFLVTKLRFEKHISVDTLLKFNKLEKLLEGCENQKQCVIEACEQIDEIVVNDEKISLLHPIDIEAIENYKLDAITRSIYFENIPDSSDHDSIKKVFRKYGKILYISLPRYPESQIIKGFGFVEFAETSSCDMAIAKLNGRILKSWNKIENYEGVLRIMTKTKWQEYKERLQILRKRLRIEEPSKEYMVRISNLPDNITQTQIRDFLQIKPWKIEYKSGNSFALLIFATEIDKAALLRCQPYIHGRQALYLDVQS